MAGRQLLLRVASISAEAKDVLVIELRDPKGAPLPPFSAGAHLEIRLPNGLIRHYSLCNDPSERDRYRIGIGLARDSRGGSHYLHQLVRTGDQLTVGEPRNNFPLYDGDGRHNFVAGGIGITPMLSMIRACEAQGKDWSLTYLVRSRQRAAFLEDLIPFGDRVTIRASVEIGGRCDIADTVRSFAPGDVIYCCGPSELMLGVEAAGADRPAEKLRFEWFSAKEPVDTGPQEGFAVTLAKSGRTINVPPHRSILEALEDAGIEAPYACREGICGSCEIAVISGIPDHRDQVLSAEEQASNATIMTCCSRARSGGLVLDL